MFKLIEMYVQFNVQRSLTNQFTILTGSKEETEVKFVFNGDGKEEEQMIVDDNSPDIDTGLQEKVMIKNIRVESLLFYSNEIHLYIILWETSLMKVLLRLFY